MQQVVNAAPTPGEGDRVQRMISALVTAGIDGGYLASPRLAKVHWQAAAGRCPPRGRPWPGSPRCGSTPPRSPPTPTSAKLGQALAAAGAGTATS